MNRKRLVGGLFVAGLIVVLAASGLLFLGIIESGPAAAFGIVGIGLIAASGRGWGSQP